MTYYNQLKEKHIDDVKKAYTEYILSKSIYRTFYVSEDASDFVKEAMNIQVKLNEYAEDLINKKNISLADKLGLNNDELINFMQEKEHIFDFLEIERGELIQHATGMYNYNLEKGSKNITWESLEAIIKEENNNEAILTEKETQEKLKDICNQYGLNSITYGKIRTTDKSIKKLGNSFSQLKEVVECNDNQVGLKKFSIFLDVSEFSYAGQACKCNEEIKLLLNERLSHDAFAHEWLHGMDMLMAEVKSQYSYMYSESRRGSIHKLLENLKNHSEEDIKEIKKTIIDDTKNYLNKIVDRFNLMASVNNAEELKNNLQKEVEKIIKGEYQEDNILNLVNEYMKDKNGCPSYILTELSMLNKFIKDEDKNFKNSYFYEYAKEMQVSLGKTGLMEYEYSTLKDEMFARAFESYTELKLREKGLKNDIAHSNVSAWTPKSIETSRQKSVWKEVIQEMKEVMEVYLPSPKEITKDEVKKNISKIRKNNIKTEDTVAVKFK